MAKDNNTLNMEKCSKFGECDCPVCPLDNEAKTRIYLEGEKRCPYMSTQKGVRKTAGDNLLAAVPLENHCILNSRSRNKIARQGRSTAAGSLKQN